MTTPHTINSNSRSPLRLGLLLIPVALACFALFPTASTAFAQVNVSDETSLRSAILNAAPGETINVSAGTITLTGGELVISQNLTITGQGAGATTINGNNNSRVFFINPGAPGATTPPTTSPTVQIANLTIANGNAVGGAGYEGRGGGAGAAGLGGGLLINGGLVTLDNVTFTGNSAIGGSGGFGLCTSGYTGGGGGGVGGPGLGNAGGPGGDFGGNAGDNGSPGGEGAGGGAPSSGGSGGNGGFGGGGAGAGGGAGGNGGFGGGGGGGYGAAGGSGGSFGGNGGPATPAGGCGGGGGGAGLGGAILLRSGTLNLTSSAFLTNSATGGIGGSSPGQSGTNGQGVGGAIFINDGASANQSGSTFMNNMASDADNDVHGTLTTRPPFSTQVQQPINPDGSSVFNVHRGVVPVKFTLTLGGVAICDLPPATIALTRTAGGTTGAIDESVYTGSADTGSNFRIESCQYVYNLSSGALGAGTYRVDIMINGQVVGSGSFQLK